MSPRSDCQRQASLSRTPGQHLSRCGEGVLPVYLSMHSSSPDPHTHAETHSWLLLPSVPGPRNPQATFFSRSPFIALVSGTIVPGHDKTFKEQVFKSEHGDGHNREPRWSAHLQGRRTALRDPPSRLRWRNPLGGKRLSPEAGLLSCLVTQGQCDTALGYRRSSCH